MKKSNLFFETNPIQWTKNSYRFWIASSLLELDNMDRNHSLKFESQLLENPAYKTEIGELNMLNILEIGYVSRNETYSSFMGKNPRCAPYPVNLKIS